MYVGRLYLSTVRSVALRAVPRNTVDEADQIISEVFRRVWPRLCRSCLAGRPLDETTRTELRSAARRLTELGLSRSAMVELTRGVVAVTERQVASVEQNLSAVRALRISKYSLVVVHDVIASLLEPDAMDADLCLVRDADGDDEVSRLDHEILRRLAYGQSSSEIAAELHYSKQAVSYHLSRLLSKYGVPNRTALVAMAYENGLLPIRVSPDLRAS